jgi:hypothetical protein
VGAVGRDKQPPQASRWVGCHQTFEVHRGAEKHDAGVRRTGGLQMRPRKTGGVRPRKPPSDGAPSELGAVLRLALRTPPPTHDAFFRAPMHDSHNADAAYPQEARSGCAAQRAGARPVVALRITVAERVPLASTCVATESPIAHANADAKGGGVGHSWPGSCQRRWTSGRTVPWDGGGSAMRSW